MRIRAAIPLLTAFIAASPPAHAQNADLAPSDENVVVTATRLPTTADDVAAGVDVIDRATIQQRGYTTLADALSAVAGVHIVQSGGPGANASVFIRGADSNQVQVLIDGVPVNDASGPGGAYNFGVETLSNIDRIEVVRGPMSAVYGSGAIGGVINIITARGADTHQNDTPHADLLIAAGAPTAILGQADLRGTAGAFDYSLSGESRSDAGFDATPKRETVYTGERDGFRTRVGSIDLGWTPTAGTRLFVDVRGRASVYGYDDVDYPAFDDPNDTGRDNDLFVRGGVQSALLNGAWHTGLSISRDQEYRRYTNLLDPSDPNQAAEDSRYLSQRTDVQFNNTLRLPDTAWTRSAALTAGYEYSAETAHERLNSSGGGFPYLASVDATDRRNSGYLGLQTTLAARTILTANIREQAVSGVGDAVTWRVGASTAFPVLASHLKASYGTAFLAPSLYDRYGIDNFGYVGNPSLRPERSHGYEIGWSADIARATAIEVTWFHTRVDNLIQTEFAPVYTSLNIASARLQGVETTLHWNPKSWIGADATYTYTDARDAQSGQLLLRRPYDTASITLTLRPIQALSIVPQLTISGADRDALVDDQGYPVGNGPHRGGEILNLNTTYTLTNP